MLDGIMDFIAHYGVLVVFASIFVESSGLPVPGESMLVAAGVLASQGRIGIVEVFLAAWIGGTLGDNVGYLLGYKFGRPFVYRYGGKIGLSRSRIALIEQRFLKRGPPIVLIARFILILRQLCGFIAGTAHMPWWRFSFYNALGAALWSGAYAGGAYLLGAAVEHYLSAGRWVFAGVAVIFVIASATTIWGFIREARGGEAEDPSLPPPPVEEITRP
ncbi:DedA family protein [Mangrovicella endophytica]|uniref:DedA family protein n=1 Tax=Mangrovicella endophytica TaxID=2066697 RepID=UPI000C9E09C2|nr:DedA family protein [Mangrovicella endophytica]